MKLQSLLEPLTDDIRTVANFFSVSITEDTPMSTLHRALTWVCRNRAYSDEYPLFKDGSWKRCLPYDGRKYCFYYVDGANDHHVDSLLRAVRAKLAAENQAQ